jgi:mannose-1-phosphate guanylyltransferase
VNAVLLVGGEGSRLRPLTTWLPKSMLPIANRPFLTHQIDHLARHGVDRVIMSCGYLARPIRDHFGSGDGRVQIDYVIEEQPLGTGGAIANAARGLDERFLVLNGDVLTDLDLGALVDFHRARDARCTISLTRVDDPSRYGLVVTRPDGAVEAFLEKPKGAPPAGVDTINAGTYVMEPEVLDLVAPDVAVSVEREVFPRLVGDGLYARVDAGHWRDIGTPESYLAANLEQMPPAGAIDPAAVVADGAEVSESVVGAEARVEPGARVTRSVLLPGAAVGSRATVADCVVGPGRAVPSGELREGGIVW